MVDLQTYGVLDQDERVPYDSFIPVGSQPSDIGTTPSGRVVVTTNFESADLSIINVASAFGPTIVPAQALSVDGPAARLAFSRRPALRDRFVFVTQPTLGRLAVVSLDAGLCPDADAESVGCLLGWLRLDNATGYPGAPADPNPAGVRPWAVVSSDLSPSLFVSGDAGEAIFEIDAEILVNEALTLAAPGELSTAALVRRLAIPGYTSRVLAVEPGLERFLYAIDVRSGGLLVVDLVTGSQMEVASEDPLADDTMILEVPGQARALTLVSLSTDVESGPLAFDGTYGLVSTTRGGLLVINVEDHRLDDERPHASTSSAARVRGW